jgi:hypothetical protein
MRLTEIDVVLDHFAVDCRMPPTARTGRSVGPLPEQLEIVQVDGARLVTTVKSDLLLPGETPHAYGSEHAVVEGVYGVVEGSAIAIGLTSVSGGVEDDRMEFTQPLPAAASSIRTGHQSVSTEYPLPSRI